MGEKTKRPGAHVVVAKVPAGTRPIIGSILYAVIADTPEQAETAVEAVAPADSVVVVTGGPLKPETAERLALVPGEPKEIG
jgi:hypothetical protein